MSGAITLSSSSCPAVRPSLSRVALLDRFGLVLLLAYTLFLFFYGLGDGELYRNEGLRAILGAEVLRSGNWIVPTLYGEPLLTKPPGMYVAIALASWPAGGVTEWTARLPSALAALGCVLLIYDYFRRNLGQRAGLMAAALIPISLGWLDKASAAEIDMVQVFWVAAAILCFERALEIADCRQSSIRNPQSAIRNWTLLALLCVAAGFLTKWTAPAFFYGTVIPLLWWRGRLRFLFCRYHLMGVVVAVALALGWAAAVVNQVGWEVLASTVSREALQRLSPAHHPRPYPWLESLVHPLRILLTALPVSIFALRTLRRFIAKSPQERRALELLHCWLWPNLLFWSVIPGHAVRNALPLFPAIAGLAALVWIRMLGRYPGVASGSAIEGAMPTALRGHAHAKPWAWHPSSSFVATSLPRIAFVSLLVLWLVAKLTFVHAIVPTRLQHRDARAKGQALAARIPPGETLYLFQVKDEGIMFYYGRPALRRADPGQLPYSDSPLYCILNETEWRNWSPARRVFWSEHLTDAQGDPLILIKLPASQHVSVERIMNPPPANVKVLSVSELTHAVRNVLEDGFPVVWVAGEVSNLSRPASGHTYLTLKDANAQLRCVIWRSAGGRVRFTPRDGMKVVAGGRLTVYPARGDYQLQVEQIFEKGIGELERRLRELKEKLHRLGYFAPERKRPLPAYPQRVGLVTSPSGAAVRDMLEILTKRWPAAEVLVCPVRVQGDGAGQAVAWGIRLLNHLHAENLISIDVMIVGRGGGSLEDLAAFNEECVARAIFESKIPVVSAVGHEVDITLADLVADRRALTPTEAATVVVPSRDEHVEALDGYRGRLRDLLLQRLGAVRQRLADLAERRVFREPLERIREREQKLDDCSDRLRRSVSQRLERSRAQLIAHAARLEALSPLNVLSRGYSLTCKEADQVLVRDAAEVRPGDRLVTRVHRGRIVSRVEDTQEDVG